MTKPPPDAVYCAAAPPRPPGARRGRATEAAVAAVVATAAMCGAAALLSAPSGHAASGARPARAAAVTVTVAASGPTPLDVAAGKGAGTGAPVVTRRQGAQAGNAATPAHAHRRAHPVVLAPPNPNPVRIAPPAGAPPAIAALVRGANLISGLPYRWGGGHQSLSDYAFDCSGSVSYVLNWAGMLRGTRTSGQLAHWGVAGRGRWLTVYANAEHTFLVVRGQRFDTRGLRDRTNSRWQATPASTKGYAARHWPGF